MTSSSETRGHRLIKQSGMYLGLSVYRVLMNIIALYVFSHILKPEEFGVLSLVAILNSVVAVLANAGLVNGVIRFFNAPEAENRRNSLVSSALWGNIGILFVVGILILIFADTIAKLLFGENGKILWLWLAFGITSTSVISTLPLSVWRMEERIYRYIVCDGLTITLSTFIGIAIVVYGGSRVNGVLLGQVLAQGGMAVLMVILMMNTYKLEFRISFLTRLLKFGSPFILIHAAYWVMDWSDQIFLKQLAGLKEVGLYSLGYRLGMMMLVVVEAYNIASLPHLFSIYREDNAKIQYGQIAMAYSSVMMIPFLVICLIAPVYFRLLTPPEFHSAIWVVPFAAFAYSLRGLYNSFAIGVQLKNKLGYLFVTEVFWAGMNIFLNIILIPYWKAMGAAAATAITFIGLLISMIIINQKIYPITVDWVKIYLPVGIAISFAGIFYILILRNVAGLSYQLMWIFAIGSLGIYMLYRSIPMILRTHLKEILLPCLPFSMRKA